MSQTRSDRSRRKVTSTWRKAKSLRVDDIRKIAEGVRKEILCYKGHTNGLCYEASVFLARSMRARGIKTRIVCGEFYVDRGDMLRNMHYWVEIVSSKIIIDITADQFQRFVKEKIPDVFIGNLPYRYKELFTSKACESTLCINRKIIRQELKNQKKKC